MLIGVLGAISFGYGTFLGAIVLRVLATEGFTSFVSEGTIAVAYCVGPGVFWIASGLIVWKRNYKYAILSFLVGLSIPQAIGFLFFR